VNLVIQLYLGFVPSTLSMVAASCYTVSETTIKFGTVRSVPNRKVK